MYQWLFFQMLYEIRIKGWCFFVFTIWIIHVCLRAHPTYSNITLDSSLGLVDNFSGVCEKLLKKVGLLPTHFDSTGTVTPLW